MSSSAARDQRIGIWVAIIVVTLTTSLALNIAHAFAYEPPPTLEGLIELSAEGRIAIALLAGILPVAMVGTLSHTLVTKAPGGVRLVVVVLFVIGLAMSTTAQYDMVLPVAGHARALGMVAIIDIPALISLYMIERAMSARGAAERERRERQERAARERHQAAERERRERLEREQRAAEAERLERLERERRAAAEAAARAAEAERAAAEQAAESERAAAERAAAEAEAERQRAAAAAAEAERLERQRRADRERAEAEQARIERLRREEAAEAERARAEQAERAERERRAAERKAAAELRERGDLTPDQKREIARAMYLSNENVTSTQVVEAVVAKGGRWSAPQARKVLAEIKAEGQGQLAEVRSLRQTAAV